MRLNLSANAAKHPAASRVHGADSHGQTPRDLTGSVPVHGSQPERLPALFLEFVANSVATPAKTLLLVLALPQILISLVPGRLLVKQRLGVRIARPAGRLL